jgi:hypothetical protein
MRNRHLAAITDKPWWLAGGELLGSKLVAYQAKGASSYAASKVNLANPGTHNAADGTAYPTWATTTGWKFNGSTQYLMTGIVPTKDYTVIIRFADISNFDSMIAGALSQPAGTYVRYSISPSYTSSNCILYGFGAANQYRTPLITSGVVGISGNQGYRNGSKDGVPFDAFGAPLMEHDIYIGARNQMGTAAYFSNGKVIAFFCCDRTITDYQVALLSQAMNAL